MLKSPMLNAAIQAREAVWSTVGGLHPQFLALTTQLADLEVQQQSRYLSAN